MNLKRVSYWSVVKYLNLILRNILFLPILLSFWNANDYVNWVTLVAASLLLLTIFDSFTQFVANRFTIEYHRNEYKALRIFGAGFKWMSLMGLVLLILSAAGLYYFKKVLGFNYGVLSYLFATVILGVCRYIFMLNDPVGKRWSTMRFETVSLLIETVLLLGAIVFVKRYNMVLLLVSLGSLPYLLYYIISILKENAASLGYFNQGKLKYGFRMFRTSVVFFVSSLLERTWTESYAFLLSVSGFPVLGIAQFTSVKTLANAAITGQNTFLVGYTPYFQENFAHKSSKKSSVLLHRIWLVSALALMGIAATFPLVEQFYKIWTKHKIEIDALLFPLVFCWLSVFLFMNTLFVYVKALNKLGTYFLVNFIKAVMFVGMLFYFPRNAFNIVAFLLISDFFLGIMLALEVNKSRILKEASLLAYYLLFLIPGVLFAGIAFYGYNIWYILGGIILFVPLALFLYKVSKASAQKPIRHSAEAPGISSSQ